MNTTTVVGSLRSVLTKRIIPLRCSITPSIHHCSIHTRFSPPHRTSSHTRIALPLIPLLRPTHTPQQYTQIRSICKSCLVYQHSTNNETAQQQSDRNASSAEQPKVEKDEEVKEEDENKKEDIKQHKEAKIRELQQQVSELRNNVLLARAEVENTRKRIHKEIEKAKEHGVEQLVKNLFSVMDTVNLSIATKPEIDPSENIEAQIAFDALETTKKQFLSIFSDSYGIEEYYPELGTPFDPSKHHALFEVDPPGSHPNIQAGTVGLIVKSGWKRNNTILRQPSVGVVKKKVSTDHLPPLAKEFLKKMNEEIEDEDEDEWEPVDTKQPQQQQQQQQHQQEQHHRQHHHKNDNHVNEENKHPKH